MSNSSLKCSGMTRVNEGSHSFTCHPHVYPQVTWTTPAFTPQPQYVILPSLGVEGWVDLCGWLHTELKCRLRESNLGTITHPSTNRAQRRLTSLIKTNALPLRQTATPKLRFASGKQQTVYSLQLTKFYSTFIYSATVVSSVTFRLCRTKQFSKQFTFRVNRRRREMYCGHARLCVCLSVRGRMPTLLHGPGYNLGEW